MPCEKFWKPIGHFSAGTRVALLRRLAECVDNLLRTACEGYLIILPGEWINLRYLQACLMIEHLLKHRELEGAAKLWRRPFESLLSLDDESDIDWEYGGRKLMRSFRGYLDELYVGLAGESVQDEKVDQLTAELKAGTAAYATQEKTEETKWLEAVDRAVEKTRSAPTATAKDGKFVPKRPLGFTAPEQHGNS